MFRESRKVEAVPLPNDTAASVVRTPNVDDTRMSRIRPQRQLGKARLGGADQAGRPAHICAGLINDIGKEHRAEQS